MTICVVVVHRIMMMAMIMTMVSSSSSSFVTHYPQQRESRLQKKHHGSSYWGSLSSSVRFASSSTTTTNEDDDGSGKTKPLFSSVLSNNYSPSKETNSNIHDVIDNNVYNTPLFSSFLNPQSNEKQNIKSDATTNNKEEKDLILTSFQQTTQQLLSSTTSSSSSSSLYYDESIQSINRAIVQKGLQYKQSKQDLLSSFSNNNNNNSNNQEENVMLMSKKKKVPGCVATVYVRTILLPIDNHDNNDNNNKKKEAKNYKVMIDGEADALLSRGLLSLLFESLYSSSSSSNIITAQHVLDIQPEKVADMLQLRSVLSRGRNDGLQSIMTVVQSQIYDLLSLEKEKQGNDDNDVNSSSSSIDATSTNTVTESIAIKPPPPQRKQDESPSLSSSQLKTTKKQPTVAMLLSGGVDSSVALNILHRQNYNITAFYLKIWLEDELSHLSECPWEDDYNTCLDVCHQINVPLETISLQEQYKERVISYTIREAERGRTPNPDVMCNSMVKFGCFYDEIEGRGFDYVASGHYAQLVDGDDNDDNDEKDNEEDKDEDKDENDETQKSSNVKQKRLLRAPDPIKDQSYFLSALTQEQLQRVLFPIGQYQKTEVRQLAIDFDLPNKNRPDSQGLCFLGKVKFDNFLSAYLGDRPGSIVDAATGEIIGNHKGLWYHTVGQRKGIGKVLYPKVTAKGPWYVVAKDPKRDLIFASNQYDEDVFTAARTDFFVEDIRWIADGPPSFLRQEQDDDGDDNEGGEPKWKEGRLDMKIRHGPSIVQGTLLLTDGLNGASGNIHLDKKDGGLAPGQFVAFYTLDGNECLGSGVISERHWANFLLDSEAVLSSIE
mmetsp:Transcript_18285/g.26819  ORF Transcript_18285/g.26819 Transcript_18285/m.26819 type:complete len:832 (+) Transcript_18285:192-2687(+)